VEILYSGFNEMKMGRMENVSSIESKKTRKKTCSETDPGISRKKAMRTC
jgi:hypothetical protein